MPREDWIAVTDASSSATGAWWSPDGNLLYFLSNRDGRTGIWAQRLQAEAKRPVGSPIEINHVGQVGRAVGGRISVAGDRLVFNLTETTGNIWMMEPQQQQ